METPIEDPNEIKIKIPIINGRGVIQTQNIKGELDCLIFNTPKCYMIIQSELGYYIYYNMEAEGINYLPIRVQAVNNQSYRINLSNTKYNLNEKLIISVQLFNIRSEIKEIDLILRIK